MSRTRRSEVDAFDMWVLVDDDRETFDGLLRSGDVERSDWEANQIR